MNIQIVKTNLQSTAGGPSIAASNTPHPGATDLIITSSGRHTHDVSIDHTYKGNITRIYEEEENEDDAETPEDE